MMNVFEPVPSENPASGTDGATLKIGFEATRNFQVIIIIIIISYSKHETLFNLI